MVKMFDDTKLKVNMNGTEYLAYKQYKDKTRKPLTKNQKIAVLCFSFSIILSLFLISLINDLTYIKPIPTSVAISENLRNSPDISWNAIAKAFVIVKADILIFVLFMIAIAWVIHGFGFIIIKR